MERDALNVARCAVVIVADAFILNELPPPCPSLATGKLRCWEHYAPSHAEEGGSGSFGLPPPLRELTVAGVAVMVMVVVELF